MSAILKLSGVSKRFGALLAVDNLSMHLNDGEALGVIGPNGSGKTTMFNILSGITKADQGEVFFQGTDITIYAQLERISANGTTLVIVEQDIKRAMAVSDRVYCIREGRVVLEGQPRDLGREEMTKAYFGM